MLLHLGAVILLLAKPAIWLWIIGAVVANHLLLIALVFWPKGRLLGPNIRCLPTAAAGRNEVALTFDDGPWRLRLPY